MNSAKRQFTAEDVGVIVAEALRIASQPPSHKTEHPASARVERRMADPQVIHSFVERAKTEHPKPGPIHGYKGKWGALVDALGGVDRCAAAIGVNPATMYRWATTETRPHTKSVNAVRAVAKEAGVPSPL